MLIIRRLRHLEGQVYPKLRAFIPPTPGIGKLNNMIKAQLYYSITKGCLPHHQLAVIHRVIRGSGDNVLTCRDGLTQVDYFILLVFGDIGGFRR